MLPNAPHGPNVKDRVVGCMRCSLLGRAYCAIVFSGVGVTGGRERTSLWLIAVRTKLCISCAQSDPSGQHSPETERPPRGGLSEIRLGVLIRRLRCPLYPRKPTNAGAAGLSAKCHKRPFTLQQGASLFDHSSVRIRPRSAVATAPALHVSATLWKPTKESCLPPNNVSRTDIVVQGR